MKTLIPTLPQTLAGVLAVWSVTLVALACLLLVGCVQEIDRDELRSALIDLHQEYYNDTLPRWDQVPDWIDPSLNSDTNVIPPPDQPQPCPPCKPCTVTLLVKIDSTTHYDGGTERHWSYVVPDTVMPPGTWINPKNLSSWPDEYWPDSAFILSKTLSEVEGKGE